MMICPVEKDRIEKAVDVCGEAEGDLHVFFITLVLVEVGCCALDGTCGVTQITDIVDCWLRL